jgi:biotin-[acetyl-CoA-carboxylase] ligase BirA-like protein
MGILCPGEKTDVDLDNIPYKEIGDREIINGEKLIVKFKIIEYDEENQLKDNSPIDLEVIHVDKIDSTMPASRQYIDEGNKLPFIYTTKIQTQGKGKGARKWAGSIIGNIYTSSSIPIKMVKNEVNSNDLLVKVTAISIIQKLREYSNEFYLKYPNDIICIEKRKLGGIIVELYKDFYIIGFGINIVDKPEQSEIRKEGLSPCFVNEHIPENKKKPDPLELSIEITKQIIYNLGKRGDEIEKLFEKYVKKDI